ncbi:hypothetical protein V1512DRAFT_258285 [Lipomyces arxii]|uniref:uncharacterized protein n=1 Tax=Lipomyces arxii TaxID=56418 RepID=UPI0034CFD29C
MPFLLRNSVKCLRTQTRKYSTHKSLCGYVDLSPRRGLIEVTGPDAFRFLHGLMTNEPPKTYAGTYATFLNVRGRIMWDVFVYFALHNKKWATTHDLRDEDTTYLIEHDVAVSDQLFKYLTFRKLRDKVNISKTTDWKVWFTWEDDGPGVRATPQFIGADDTRAPGFGVRTVLSTDAANPLWPLRVYEEGRVELFEEYDIANYDVRRIMHGVPEGVADLAPGEMLPIESNIDMMGGIDFEKGCYVGQELTTRAKRVGVATRRVVPYMLYNLEGSEPADIVFAPEYALQGELQYKAPIIQADTQPKLNSRGEIAKTVGKVLSRTGNIGLATVKVDIIESEEQPRLRPIMGTPETGLELQDAKLADEKKGIGLKVFRPYWWGQEKEVRTREAGQQMSVGV